MSSRDWFLRLLDQGKSKTEAAMIDYRRREHIIAAQLRNETETVTRQPNDEEKRSSADLG
ncbi:MAG TPA: hypothetical protein VGD01_18075 [Candidatus Elarobacter sp.]